MKKRKLMKLLLNKQTIATLNRIDMLESLAGAGPSDLGVSCFTGHCCKSIRECDTNQNDPNNMNKTEICNGNNGIGTGTGTGTGTGQGTGHC